MVNNKYTTACKQMSLQEVMTRVDSEVPACFNNNSAV